MENDNSSKQNTNIEINRHKKSSLSLSILQDLASKITIWGNELGFQKVGFSNIDLGKTEQQLQTWVEQGFHGDMEWMHHHGSKRTQPAELVENTRSIISVRMDYLPPDGVDPELLLNHPQAAYISRYALGRDYHKLLRKRLQQLATKIQQEIGAFGYRVFVDSAPVMEKPIAAKAGLGWVGKHSNILSKEAGSWFFLGEIYTDLALKASKPVEDHCGSCSACIDVCPTQAIIAPYIVDARRCISYLTIELKGAIPEEFRHAIGNRIYGCDDCQLICPWNRFANFTQQADFAVRNKLDSSHLLTLFAWSESEFLEKLQGSPIRRIGYERWLRNISVALGNSPKNQQVLDALNERKKQCTRLVKEHIDWAIQQQISQ
ncbi:MAG TPA: tRNA epoxyqueuosine(34) reductase QueG [Leucothrix mucor]|nr:tRNA epoxyqueuosine(34) reductase QueG [Leucothrix mucor]